MPEVCSPGLDDTRHLQAESLAAAAAGALLHFRDERFKFRKRLNPYIMKRIVPIHSFRCVRNYRFIRQSGHSVAQCQTRAERTRRDLIKLQVAVSQNGKKISVETNSRPNLRSDSPRQRLLVVSSYLRSIPLQLLPKGYPSSVSPTYMPYAVWHGMSAILSAAGGVLSMQALLHAVGVGAGSVPLAASLQWVLKDGLGQLGGILFAGAVSSKYDTDVKRWRLASAGALDAACLLECALPLMPGLFLPVAAAANVAKNVAWLSASATRAGIHQSLAQGGTLADVTAKSGSQSIAASVAGTALGMAVAAGVPSVAGALGMDPAVGALLAFLGLSAGHLGCLWRAVGALALPTLNAERLGLCAAAVLPCPGSQWQHQGQVPSPEEARKQERLLLTPAVRKGLGLGPGETGEGPMGAGYRRWAAWEQELELVVGPVICGGDLEAGLAAEAARVLREREAGLCDDGAAMVWVRSARVGGESEVSVLKPSPSLQVCVSIPVGASWRCVVLGVLRAEAARAHLVEAGGTGGPGQAKAALQHAYQIVHEHGAGDNLVEALEGAGWWVGRPLLEEDVERRVDVHRV